MWRERATAETHSCESGKQKVFPHRRDVILNRIRWGITLGGVTEVDVDCTAIVVRRERK